MADKEFKKLKADIKKTEQQLNDLQTEYLKQAVRTSCRGILAMVGDEVVGINKETLADAFVAGAKWWEFTRSGDTMWNRDVLSAEEEANRRYPEERRIEKKRYNFDTIPV